MGIDVHGSSYIGVAQKFLHILGCCAIGQKIGCEGMSEQVEMKLSKIRHYLSRPAADAAYRCGGFKGSIRSYADHGQFLIPLRYFLGSLQAIHLIVDPVLFPYFFVVVEGIEGPYFKLFLFCSVLAFRSSAAKVSQKSTVRIFFRLVVPISVLCRLPLYHILRRTVRHWLPRCTGIHRYL